MKSMILKLRLVLILALLEAAVATALIGAFQLRFEFAVPVGQRLHLLVGLTAALIVKLVFFFLARLHRGWKTYAGTRELLRILAANAGASLAFAVVMVYLFGGGFPRSVYVLDFLLCFMLLSGMRFFARVQRETFGAAPRVGSGKAVLIYGAGWAGSQLVRELQLNQQLGVRVLGFVDDDHRKRGERILGAPVLGDGRDLVQLVSDFRRHGEPLDEILIAMPNATGRQMQEATANCRAAGLPCRTLPSITDLLANRALQGQMRQISVEDLLGRDMVRLDEARIWETLTNRVVMVTGAAGSIGSELCRQIAAFRPQALVLFDQAESDLFRIDLELRAKFPALTIVPEIGDIRKGPLVERVLRRHGVNLVFHAAAYKHVPLMETHALAAMENNVLGTYVTARAAMACGVATFVLISSDKAVNPVNVMGATKRATELIVSSFPADAHSTRFVAVRFGNVLASNGSVVPVFQKQIATGGPVTVTHPEVRRYFMTVREAVQLVLQASTMGNGSEIYVLDMGELIKIDDLARNMIRLAGLVPGEDIEIRYVGLRPGEKLFEELITEGEHIMPTHHAKIKIFKGAPASPVFVENWIERVRQAVLQPEDAAAVALLKELIPEYEPSNTWSAPAGQPPEPIEVRG